MIEALQPYPGRKANEWLADLQRLSNPDKHKTLTLMPTYLIGYVQLTRLNPASLRKEEPLFRITQDVNGQDIYVRYPIHLGVSIEGNPVDDILGLLKRRVRQTLESFRSEFSWVFHS